MADRRRSTGRIIREGGRLAVRFAVGWVAVGCAAALVVACATDESAQPGSASAVESAGPTGQPAPSIEPACARRGPKRWAAASQGASSAIARVDAGARKLVLVADGDAAALHVFDADALVQLGVTRLDGRPSHVLALDSGLVAITLRDRGEVVIAEPGEDAAAPLEVRCRIDLAPEPWAMAESDGRLLVTSGWGAALSVVSLETGTVERELGLPREPRAVLALPGSRTAFVSHAVGGVVTAVDLDDLGKAPDRIDVRAGKRMKNAFEEDDLPREGSQGYALASVELVPGHRRVLAPSTSEDPGASAQPIAPAGYGGAPDHRAVAPIVSVIDPVARRSMTRSALGENASRERQDCLLPRGAAVRDARLYVACMDLDAIVVFDASISDPSRIELARVHVPTGPVAVIVDDRGDAFTWSEIDPAISRIERGAEVAETAAPWRPAGVTRDPVLTRGRQLFHASRDARIGPSRACATCHPDGRDDGLVWSSPDGARQTPSLAGRIAGAAPYGWFGEHRTVKEHVASTLSRLGGTGMSAPKDQPDLDALVAYVASLPPPPAPKKPSDGPAVVRGKLVFQAYGCQHCHADGGTDGKQHDVGSGGVGERRQELDTPSLRGVAKSAPYFHDGRYATLEELIRSKDTKMIDGTQIEASDRAALAAFLETL